MEVTMQKLFIAIWFGTLVFAVAPAPLLAQIQPQTPAGDGRLTDRPLVTSSVDEFASELDGARESFLYVDGRDASLRIRHVIAMMQERAKDATDAGKQAINNSVVELDSLAISIEQRRLPSVRPLDEAFDRANLAMANKHLLLAIRAKPASQATHRRRIECGDRTLSTEFTATQSKSAPRRAGDDSDYGQAGWKSGSRRGSHHQRDRSRDSVAWATIGTASRRRYAGRQPVVESTVRILAGPT
jgi:hypothetical protein